MMEAYVLSARGEETILRCEEEEDIGCPSSGSLSASDEVELAETDDDASSSGSTTAQCHFEMASLMTHLPIKRGLSKFFDGKSQSFASLAAVAGLEDLPKPPPAKRLKASRSYGLGLKDAHRAGKKKASRAARLSLPAARKLVIRTLAPSVTASPGEVAGQPLLFA